MLREISEASRAIFFAKIAVLVLLFEVVDFFATPFPLVVGLTGVTFFCVGGDGVNGLSKSNASISRSFTTTRSTVGRFGSWGRVVLVLTGG